jgi:hypothetical protein
LDEEAAVIENDMSQYIPGDMVELSLPAGDALTIDFSGPLPTGESIIGQLTVIVVEDGTYLTVIGFGRYDGPNDMWEQEGYQMYTHLLESLEIYPQDQNGDVCPSTDRDATT